MTDFLETQRSGRGDIDISVGTEFKYSAHSGELRIGDIFIRIYNQQPTYQINASIILKTNFGANNGCFVFRILRYLLWIC